MEMSIEEAAAAARGEEEGVVEEEVEEKKEEEKLLWTKALRRLRGLTGVKMPLEESQLHAGLLPQQ